MNEEFWRWYMYGHWICLAQWLGFIMVEYAYLGKGKIKHPLVWSGVITMLTMTLSVVYNFGFFTPRAVALTILFLFITVMLFGGTPGQKFTACLINGTMCLLVENSMRYVISWILKCELQQVIQRADCLIIIAVANMVVGAAVAFLVSKWRRRNALEPLQALTMSFFPGVVVVLNILLMLTDNNKRATMATMGMTVGLTVAVMVHLCIVAMFNDQVMQRRSLYFQAELEQQRASALLDSYTAQRRLTHEFTNHISALRALLEQGDVAGAQDYIAGVDKAVAASTTIMDTHNPLLDSILTRKYEEATRQGVSVYFDLCDLRNFPLSGVWIWLPCWQICWITPSVPQRRRTRRRCMCGCAKRRRNTFSRCATGCSGTWSCRWTASCPAPPARSPATAWGFPTCGTFCCAMARSIP